MPAMQLQLYGLGHVPPTLPMWSLIMEDLAHPEVGSVMRVLGVEAEQVQEWNRTGRAPKWACLALFWLTRWGRSEVHQQAAHDAIVAVQCLRAVERERDQLALVVDVMRHGLAGLGGTQPPVGYRGEPAGLVEVSGLAAVECPGEASNPGLVSVPTTPRKTAPEPAAYWRAPSWDAIQAGAGAGSPREQAKPRKPRPSGLADVPGSSA